MKMNPMQVESNTNPGRIFNNRSKRNTSKLNLCKYSVVVRIKKTIRRLTKKF